ncbi:HET-domain-containing protein [Ustulina deusta]|nr:HET-domain-containing protein [Ustulina deusta]
MPNPFARVLNIGASRWRARVDRNPTLDSDPNTVPIDPKWINLDEIRQWIHVCTTHHGKKCETTSLPNIHIPQQLVNWQGAEQSQGALSQRPAWLVDVKDECIVPAAAAHRYIALSYVWGAVTGTEATRSIMDILQRPGALGKQSKQIIVPRTIRHAMELTSLLGERYLWVDRFCICQDDAGSKHSQLNLMGQIFGGAHFTIVAANGWDANHGLRGIRGVTEPRNLTSQQLAQSEYIRCIDPASTVWYSRGWTYQEMSLSPRTLLFVYQYVIWECPCAVWHESTGTTGSFPTFANSSGTQSTRNEYLPGPRIHRKRLRLDDITDMGLNPMKHYLRFVCEYNARALTFPEDGLNAFLGITTQFMKYFPDGFLWALPIARFDIALLWQPAEDMTRRQPRRANALQLPSWSWVGWQGLIDNQGWDEEYETEISLAASRTPELEDMPPFVPFCTLINPICEFIYTENGSMKSVKPPYVVSQRDHRAAPVQQPSPILLVHGPVARYKVRSGATSARCRKYMNLCLKWIYEPESPRLSCGLMFMSPSLHSITGDVECELLVLSSAISPLIEDPNWRIILRGYPSTAQLTEKGFYEYYNVLWITRKDGIAYRRGLGKIAINTRGRLLQNWEHLQLG